MYPYKSEQKSSSIISFVATLCALAVVLVACGSDTRSVGDRDDTVPVPSGPTIDESVAAWGDPLEGLPGNPFASYFENDKVHYEGPVDKGFNSSPGPLWQRQRGTPSADLVFAAAASFQGDVYIAGRTSGALDGNPPLGFGTDAILSRYNSAGTWLWTRQFGSDRNDEINGVAVHCPDPANCNPGAQIYLAGTSDGITTGAPNSGGRDIIAYKYSANGNVLWNRQIGSSGVDAAAGAATDVDGNMYVAGYTNGDLAGTGALGGTDAVLVKYDVNGNFQWTRQFGTALNEQARGVATDPDGNVYVSGYTQGNMNGANAGLFDVFVVKYDTNGNQQWVVQDGSSSVDYAQGIATTKVLDGTISVYVTGYTYGTLQGQTSLGVVDAAVWKLTETGTIDWRRQYGSAGRDIAFSVTSDGGSNVYIAGMSNYNIQNNTAFPASNDFDIFTAKWSANGDLLDQNQLTSADANLDVGYGIATDIDSGLYVAGYTTGEVAPSHAGGYDIFVARYEDGCTVDTTPTDCNPARSTGDPHLVTLDGVRYDFQSHGEFILMESTDSSAFTVQARQEGRGCCVAVHTAIAAQVGTDRVGIYAGENPPVRVNGTPLSLAIGQQQALPDNGRIRRRNSYAYVISWATGERFIVHVYSGILNVYASLPSSRADMIQGLFGNFNGDRTDDFAFRDGSQLNGYPSFVQMYNGPDSFAQSWRISPAESLFDYALGEDTQTFTNLNFPRGAVYLTTLPAADVATAEATCIAAGVTNPELLEDCKLDVAATGDNDFANHAADTDEVSTVVDTGAPPEPVSTGVYFNSFEAPPGPEWSIGTIALTPDGSHTFLGEFGMDTATLTLSGLPGHDNIILSFELLIVGGWDGDGPLGPNFWGLSDGNGVNWIYTTFSNTFSLQSYPDDYPGFNLPGTGAIETNSMGYFDGDSIYQISLVIPHTEPDLTLNFFGDALIGFANEGWGIDNIDIQLD